MGPRYSSASMTLYFVPAWPSSFSVSTTRMPSNTTLKENARKENQWKWPAPSVS